MRPAVLDVPFHRQDNDCFCGPATVMMALRFFNRIPLPTIRQAALLRSIQASPLPPFVSSPVGMADTLNAETPFHDYAVVADDADAIAKILVEGFCREDPAPAALLMYGCSHWCIVTGVLTDPPDLTPGADYAICGFYMNVPTRIPPPGSSGPPPPPPPPHSDTDSCANNHNHQADDYHRYINWKEEMVSPCNLQRSKVVAICRPGPAMGNLITTGCPPFPLRLRRLTSRAARKVALEGISHQRVLERSHDRHALVAGKPHRVKRLHRPSDHYYLVPLYRATTYVGMALVDHAMGFAALHFGEGEPPIVYRDTLQNQLSGTLLEEPGAPSRKLEPGTFDVRSTLVWRPSKESSTPFQPFHQVDMRSGRFFVRTLDHAIFPNISDPCVGG